ncbi:MAG: hypothetical protein GEV06_19830 [Luteitalea sp.]|nr:hypothetical protein [Luteitalea sp.]
MPLYDVRCTACEAEVEVFAWTADRLYPCRACGAPVEKLPTARVSMRPDSIPGGLVLENLGSRPVKVESWSERKRIMRDRGLVESVRHVGARGSDKSVHTSRWT